MENPNPNINPQHYKSQPHECIEFTRHLCFVLGNAFKYVFRYRFKNGLEDLEKARWYLEAYKSHSSKRLDKAELSDLVVKLSECRFSDSERRILTLILIEAASNGYGHSSGQALEILETLIGQYEDGR